MKETLFTIKTKDNISIALWKLSRKNNSAKNVLLTHGAFSNRKVCDGLSSFLVDKGFNCWIMEWRNHGSSSDNGHNFNFETIAKYDLKSTLNYLINDLSLQNIHCIAHSGGGIALTMFLIKNPEYLDNIDSITFFGVQACGAGIGWKNRVKIFSSKLLAALYGKVPAKLVGSTEQNETYYTMKQWFNWNLSRKFIGNDNFDYLSKMYLIQVPILSICAKGDRFISPKIGCEKFLNAFNNVGNKLIYCSKEAGYLEDYNHGRIILSKNSKIELWPEVYNWISEKTIANTI